jgi:type II secretory pathway component PulJ
MFDKMKKGYTLLEIIVTSLICLTLFSLIFTVVYSMYSGGDLTYISPRIESVRQQKQMVEELRRQNELMEQQLKQQKENE